MDPADVDRTGVVSNTPESAPNEGEEEKEKLTKAEKKLKYGTANKEPALVACRELIKDLIAPVDKTTRTPEEEQEAAELAESALCEIFGGAENPYRALYDIYDVFSDNKEKYKRVHKCLFKTFETWIEKCGTPEKTQKWLSTEFKVETMEKVVNKGTGQLETLLRIFQLKEADVTDLVTKKIKALCESQAKQNLGDAMRLAYHFDLQDKFDIEYFVIPMMLMDRQDDVDKFIKGHIRITRALVEFLDQMIDESDNFKLAKLQPYVDRKIILDKKAYEFVTGKRIQSLLKKLVSPDFGMTDAAAPNYESKKIKDKLRYLLFDRDTTDGSFTTTIFDHVKTHIKKDSPTAKDVIIALFDRIDRHDRKEDKMKYYAEAEMWMLYYELDPTKFFPKIRDYFATHQGWRDRAKKMLEKFDTGVAANVEYQLEDGTPIVWIDRWEALEMMLSEIEALGTNCVIGIDSEFRSTTNYKQEIALLQVSSAYRVYLVDFELLHNCLSKSQWETFTLRLWGGEHMKIGFDMLSDIKAYACTLSLPLEELQSTMTRVVCLKRLANDLLDVDGSIIDLSQSTSHKNRVIDGKAVVDAEIRQRAIKLSDLVEVVLGMHLDKSLQKSNWSMRPLRQEQVIYAATDANILIKVFQQFGELAKAKGLEYGQMVTAIENDLAERKETQVEKKKKTKMTEEEYAALVESINAAVLSANDDEDSPKTFITDSSFGGLGKHLRRLGVDVIFAESKEHLMRLGRQHPRRIILSYGKHITEYRSVFADRIFVVDIGMAAKDQVKRVLTQFKIRLSPADVFTRCMLCNGDRFVMAPAIALQTLHDCAKRVGEAFDDETFDPHPWKTKIEQANPEDARGFECSLEEFNPEEGRFIVKCTNGVLDVYNGIVMADSMDCTVDVQALQVQQEVIDSERPFYYICGSCGKIYWDGTHGKRYQEFANGVVGTGSSVSDESFSNGVEANGH